MKPPSFLSSIMRAWWPAPEAAGYSPSPSSSDPTPPVPEAPKPMISCEVAGVIALLRAGAAGWTEEREHQENTYWNRTQWTYTHLSEPVVVTRVVTVDYGSRSSYLVEVASLSLPVDEPVQDALHRAIYDVFTRPGVEAEERRRAQEAARVKALAEPTLARLRALGCPDQT